MDVVSKLADLFGRASTTRSLTIMGKLNIAHHKSYHPYRRDNIERVKRDEEEARLKEQNEEGRMMLAVRKNIILSLDNQMITTLR